MLRVKCLKCNKEWKKESTFSWGPEVESLKDCDYVFTPNPMTNFVKEFRAADYTSKFIGTDNHCAFFGMVSDAQLWDEIDGMLFFGIAGWWNDDTELIEFMKNLLMDYHPDIAAQVMQDGAAYGAVDPIYQMIEIIKDAVEAVGAENLDSNGLLAAAEKLSPDVIVADISMPLLNGIEAAKQIKKAQPDIKIVFLTMHPDVTYAASAFEAGASGYVLKHSAPSELITAINSVLAGQQYVTPLIAKELMEFNRDGSHDRKEGLSRLTPRQREVLQLLAEGRSAKEIAAILNISSRTVEFHKYKMMEELGAKTATELVRFAVKHGVIEQ